MTAFRPPALLANRHLQTAWATLVGRRVPVGPEEIVRFRADDGEPLVAVAHWQPGRRSDAPAALLVHGMEGSSRSHYMLGTAARLLALGWHVVRLEQRGCGLAEGTTATLYHVGRSEDAAAALEQLVDEHGVAATAVVGFSLGGNQVLRLLGLAGPAPPGGLFAAAAVSPVLRPRFAQRFIDSPANLLYRRFFVRRLKARMQRRARMFPDRFDLRGLSAIRTVWAFDDRFTAPLCGFDGAADYYRRSAAFPHLERIALPTLLLHAEDDPVVPFGAVAGAGRIENGSLDVVFTRRGGHVGFFDPRSTDGGYWAEARVTGHLEGARRSIGI